MKARVCWLIVSCFSAGASARPLVASDRFVVLQHKEVEIATDVAVGLTSGKLGKQVAVDTGYLHDRHGGLSGAVGLFTDFEVGVALKGIQWQEGLGAEFGGLDVYALWAFLPFAGMEVSILVTRPASMAQGESALSYQSSPTLRLGLPFRFSLIESVLALFSRTDFLVSFRRDETAAEWLTDFGCTVNLTPWLYAEGYVALSKPLKGLGSPLSILKEARSDLAVPLGAGLGLTLWQRWDLFFSFNLQDVRNRKAEARNFTFSSAFRF